MERETGNIKLLFKPTQCCGDKDVCKKTGGGQSHPGIDVIVLFDSYWATYYPNVSRPGWPLK